MNDTPKLSDAEWEVMNVVWKKFPVTANEVVANLARQKSWKPGTVKTFLKRLLDKKALRFDLEGKRYLYRPKVAREKCVRMESRSFLERVFRGAAAPMLVHFVKKTRLAPLEIEEIKQILAEKEKC
ncbi:MAG: BlaI/MecI/CopY family transcriptional regulator [Verrucomicrobia bacterium]|nr:BlaI/MecI/CopY family transcriptional regulator [Verrucomicrobiota bacterium]